MSTEHLAGGISIHVPPTLRRVPAEAPRESGRRGPGLPSGPVPLPVGLDESEEQAALLDALREQEMEVAATFAVEPRPETLSRMRAEPAAAMDGMVRVDVPLAAGEEAVVLTEQDGYYAWHFPDRREALVPGPVRRGQAAGAVVRATFTLDVQPVPVAAAQRGLLDAVGGLLFGRVRSWVLKFAAGVLVGNATRLLEKHVRKGLVELAPEAPEGWRRMETLADLRLPRDRPARILLFVHGTFSSTVGSYGALGLTPWGRALLESARGAYDAVVGIDHPTLSEDPLENAMDLLARLRAFRSPHPPHFDAVCFSRGALVLRSLTEHLLPGSGWEARFDRVVFVGSTNGGTRLAEPDNWERLVDLYTNVAVAAMRALGLLPQARPFTTVLGEVVKSLGALVRYIVSHAVTERRVPGLAAMEPDGAFVRTLNQAQPGQVMPDRASYYAVLSTFRARVVGGRHEPAELPVRLVLALADRVIDRLMNAGNDLVVDTDSMTAIDRASGVFVRDVLDFGENPSVYHTNYFTRPEVSDALARWLRLPPPAPRRTGHRGDEGGRFAPGRTAPGDFVPPEVPAAVDVDILVLDAGERADEAAEAVESAGPSFVVVHRDDAGGTYKYAFPADHALARFRAPDAFGTLAEVLDLHESNALETVSVAGASSGSVRFGGPHRTVVTRADGGYAGVVRAADDVPDTERLAELATWIVEAPSRTDVRILGRRTMPTFAAPAPVSVGPPQAPPSAPPPRPTEPPRHGEPESPPPPPATDVEAPPAACHFFAEMDQEVVVNRVATVEVVISREAMERAVGPAAALSPGPVPVDPARRLIVQVIPRAHCEVVGDDRAEVDVPAQNAPHRLYFDVRPTHLGEGAVWVLVRQGQVPLITLALSPRFVEQRSRGVGRAAAEASTPEARPLQRPLHQLRITEQFRGDQSFFEYELASPGLGLFDRFQSRMFKIDRAVYVDALYATIENTWVGSGSDAATFQDQLRAFGGELLDELIPGELQRILWKHRDAIDSIMVISTEPFIPWELVHLKDPDAAGFPAEVRFLGQMGLVRWLHGNWPPESLYRERVRYVIPEYPHPQYVLPETAEERAYLERRFRATAVPPEPAAVRDLVAQPGAFDVLHFACHGGAEHGQIAHAKLMMQGRIDGAGYVPAYLTASTVEQFANLPGADGRRPLVVLNACQTGRAGFKLTGLGGFAQAFLRKGAGAFVGALWSVGDTPARTFVEALYEALLAGTPLAQATRDAREAARAAGEATWLAYVVYGHPHAGLR